MIRRSFQRVGTYFYFLPTYSQAKKVVWDNIDNDGFRMLDHIPKALIKSTNATELKVELLNGSIIQLMAADEFKETGVGTNPVGVVFSEYSLSDPQAWQFLSPILAANDGWAIFNFTPRGKNHAWQLLQKAKDNDKWFWQVLTVDDTQVISGTTLAEEKVNNPEAFFQQEYYCNFIDGSGQFFRRIKENIYNGEQEIDAERVYQLGVDLAKYQDYTVLTPFDLNTFVVHRQDRFNQVDWNLQEARIEATARRFNQARVKIDATGVGDPIVESLKRKGLNIGDEDAIKFTETSRTNLLNHLAMLLEQDRLKIPNDEGLVAELESFQYSLGPTGKLRIGAPETMHDDRVVSLALAVHGATEPLGLETRRGPRVEFNLYGADYE